MGEGQIALVGEMDTQQSQQHPSLSSILAGQTAGTWVVLDANMSRVIGTAETPEEAMRQARAAEPPTAFNEALGERPVIVQVPDPSMMCFY